MTLSRNSLLFVDATCFVAAAISPTGGSGFILEVGQRGYLRLCASPVVLQEADRNLRAKAPAALAQHRLTLATVTLTLVALPPANLIQQYHPVFGKDDHVVAGALSAGADLLITLDRRLIDKIKAEELDLPAVTPAEFLQTLLPTHPEFRSIRP